MWPLAGAEQLLLHSPLNKGHGTTFILVHWIYVRQTFIAKMYVDMTWYSWWLKSWTIWYGKYPIIYRVLHIPGGAGFQPSTVGLSQSIYHWDLGPFAPLERSKHLGDEGTRCSQKPRIHQLWTPISWAGGSCKPHQSSRWFFAKSYM